MKFLNFLIRNNVKSPYHPIEGKIIKEYNKIRGKEKRKYLCHAPFKSMTFFRTGDVLACWYNKLFPLGRYPEDSIHDIWFSNKAKKLRQYILHNDLSYGCSDCRKSMKARNFYNVGAWRYDFLPDHNSNYPVSLDFQISNACNLQCIMCNGEASAMYRAHCEKMEFYKNPYDDNFIKQLEPFIPHLKEASFSGGEPFFAGEFYKIWDLIIAINPKIRISVTTNGNILNDKVKKYLNALDFNITLSLDAISKETYEGIRVNGNFELMMKNLAYFKDYTHTRGTDFGVKICPMRQNWQELPELAKFLNEKNIFFLFNTVIYPQYCSICSLRSDKIKEILTFLKQFRLSTHTSLQKENAVRYKHLIEQIEGWYNDALQRDKINFYALNAQELAEIFINNVKNYLDNELNYLKAENPEPLEKYKELVSHLINESPDEVMAQLGMRFYASTPIDRMLAEIEIRNYEKNKDRFLQIGRFGKEADL